MGAGLVPVAAGGGVLAEWSLRYFGPPADPVTVVGAGGYIQLAEPPVANDPLTTGYAFHSSGTGVTVDPSGILLLSPGLWSISFTGTTSGFSFFGLSVNLDDDNLGGATEVFDSLLTGFATWTGRVVDNCGVLVGYSLHAEPTPQPIVRYSISVIRLA